MPGTAVEQVEAQDLARRNHLNHVVRTANVIATSSLLRDDLRKNPADVQVIALTLDQMGIPPGIMNINRGFVVKGRVDFETRVWTAMAARAGYEVWPDDASDGEAGIAHIRRLPDGQVHTVRFTWQDAVQAGLTGSDTYKRYGRDMLIWRALKRAMSWHAPDVMAGIGDFGPATVAHAAPRPVGGMSVLAEDDDVVDAELVDQGEDTAMPGVDTETGEVSGHATAAPPGPAAADEQDEVYANRRRRANAVMGEVGVKTDEGRHELVSTATGGATRSTGRLTAWQVEAIVDFCGRLKADQTVEPAGTGENGGGQIVEPSTAPPPPRPVAGDWPALAKHHDVSLSKLLLVAREKAVARALPPPGSIEEVTDEQLVADLMDWLGEPA